MPRWVGALYRLGFASRTAAIFLAGMLLLPMVFLLGMAAASLFEAPMLLGHLATTTLPGLLTHTLYLALGVMLLTSTMGVLCAWWVSAYDFPGRFWLEWLLFLPLAMPAYVVAYAYTDALQYSGWLASAARGLFGSGFRLPDIRTTTGAIVVLSCVLYPYVYLMARAAFLERSPAMLEAARSLGLNAAQAFWRVVLPVARPAWVAGLALVLMETLAEYGTLSYFGVPTFTTAIYNTWLNMGDRNTAALLASMLLGVMVVLLYGEARARGQARFYTQQGRGMAAQRKRLRGGQAWLVAVLVSVPIVLGFVLPVLVLLGMAFLHMTAALPSVSRLAAWAYHSVLLGALAASMACVLAVLFAYVRRVANAPWVVWAHRVVTLGYGIPGAILAIAILLPLARFDQLSYQWGWSVPAVTGTVMALLYAYCVRFTSAALQSVDAGMHRLTRHIDESARVLGCNARQVLWRIHLPMLRGPLAVGALLVFVDVVKELPATLVLRPFDFDTLAVVAYQLASDERLAEAAIPALCIVLVALPPVLLLIRQGVGKHVAHSERLEPLPGSSSPAAV